MTALISINQMNLRTTATSMLMTIERLQAEQNASVLLCQAEKAEAAGKVVRQLYQSAEDADQARKELARFALFARYQAGLRLAALKPGSRGRKGKGPRRLAAEEAGLSRQETHRLVEFAALPEADVLAVVESYEEADRVPTIRGIVSYLKGEKTHAGKSSAPQSPGPKKVRTVAVSEHVYEAVVAYAARKGMNIKDAVDTLLSEALES